MVWQVALKAWGGIDYAIVERAENNLRFQGQYFDAETGLHYNRFRHYDPSAGCFINQDPIGLLGGEISAAYAPNTNHWIDRFGLTTWDDFRAANQGKGWTPQQMSDNYRLTTAYQSNNAPSTSVHGNSHASTKTTYGYIIRERTPDGSPGRILKFGETSNPNPIRRYTNSYYGQNNAVMQVVKKGSKAEMHRWQHQRIVEYENRHGVKPSLNKCYY